jgi:hypothetical protein
MTAVKRPAFQFYPGDWLRDANLRICSAGARALWIDMLCLMHQAKPYGHLVFNGRPLEDAQLGRMIGESTKDVTRWLKELEDAGVPSRTADGVIYSRRMVKDEAVRNVRASGGPKGKGFGQLGADHGVKGGRPPAALSTDPSTTGVTNPPSTKATGVSEPPLEPPPSSSSSSSVVTSSQVSPAAPAAVDNTHSATPGKSKPEASIRTRKWWSTDEGILAEGKRQGVEPRSGETMQAFKERLFQSSRAA